MSSSSEDLHRGFGNANYLREFCAAVNTLSITVQKGHAAMLTRLGVCVQVLFLMAMKARTHIVENRGGLLEGGIVPLLARLVPWVRKSTELSPNFADGYTTAITLNGLNHPRVIRRFLRMYPDGEVPGLEGCRLATSELWEFRWKQALLFCEVYQKFDEGGVVTMCDNQACMRREEGLGQRAPSRQCAGCSSVVYCSTACQEEDWRSFHGRECRQACQDHVVRRSLHTWYSHSVRQFHTQWVAETMVSQRGGGAPLMHRDNPSETMAHLDCSEGEIATRTIDISTRSAPPEILWSPRKNTAYPQEFLKPRHASLFQRYRSGLAGPKTKLAALFLCFGQHSYLDLIVLLEPVGGGVYRGVYSIARHGYDSQVDLLPRHTLKLVPPSES